MVLPGTSIAALVAGFAMRQTPFYGGHKMVPRYRYVLTSLSIVVISASLALAQSPRSAEPLNDNAALKYWTAFGLMSDNLPKHRGAIHKAVETLGPVGGELTELLQANEAALRELRRGAAQPRCEWGQSLEDGVNLPLPHAWRASLLGKLACLAAQRDFEQGKRAEAIDNLIAAMTLARHSVSPPLLITVVVDESIEGQAIYVAAGYLNTLGAAEMKCLSERIDRLPAAGTISQAVLGEKEIYLEWFIKTVSEPGGKETIVRLHRHVQDGSMKPIEALSQEQLRQGAIQLRPFYDKLAEIAKLPLAEAEKAAEDLQSEAKLHGPARPLAELLLPSVTAGRRNEIVHLTRLALLKAAIAVCQDGPQALLAEAHKDPFPGVPFQYEKTASGFRLHSKTLADGKPMTLEVGRVPRK
jgi:hypothetical protein